MQDFSYYRPHTLQEALVMLERFGRTARVLAGGTDLLVSLRGRRGSAEAENIIDISYLRELSYLKEDGGTMHIGALATHEQAAQSDLIIRHAGLLAKACLAVGSPQIRNRGTIGGNIANAAVCADTVAPLVALEACVKLESSGGHRLIPVEAFITGPNCTTLAPGEMLTEITFAKLPPAAGWGYERLARREALAIARMNVGVVADRDSQGKISYIRIAPGSVLPSPARLHEAEDILLGHNPDEVLIHQAGEAAAAKMLAESGRRWSTEYKEPVLIVLVERAIKQALGVEWK